MAELVNNCRNVHEIARPLRRHLDGARAPMILVPRGTPWRCSATPIFTHLLEEDLVTEERGDVDSGLTREEFLAGTRTC